MKNYYEILNIDSNTPKEELKSLLNKLHKQARYRTASMNKKIKNEADDELEIIEEAIDILLDDEKRKEYDASLKQKSKIVVKEEATEDDDYSRMIKTEKTSIAPDEKEIVKDNIIEKQETKEKKESNKAKVELKVESHLLRKMYEDMEKRRAKENESEIKINEISKKLESNKSVEKKQPLREGEKEKQQVTESNNQSYGKGNNTSYSKPIKQETPSTVLKKKETPYNKGNQTTPTPSTKTPKSNPSSPKASILPTWMKTVIILLVIVLGPAAYFTGGSFRRIDMRSLFKGDTELISAIYTGSVGRVNYLIEEQNASPNRTERDGNAPLHAAVHKRNSEMVQILVDAGAKINAKGKDGKTPLQLAFDRGHFNEAELLIKLGADVNQADDKGITPFFSAVSRYADSEEALMEALLEAGADVNKMFPYGTTPLQEMIAKHYVETSDKQVIEFINRGADIHATNDDGRTALHYAAKYEKIDTAKVLIDLGVDINAKDKEGKTPLALQVNNIDMMKLLIEAGADINTVDNEGKGLLFYSIYSLEPVKFLVEAGIDANIVDNEGRTALFNTIYDLEEVKYLVEVAGLDIHHLDNTSKNPLHVIRDGEAVEYLVAKAVDINGLDDEGRSPIFYDAVNGGYLQSRRRLVELGADISIVDNYGRTPLHYERHAGSAEFLVELGLDVNQEDNMGLTPLHYAVTQRLIDYDHIRMLLDLGANVTAEDYEGNTPLQTLKKHAPPLTSALKSVGGRWHESIIQLLESRGGGKY